MIDPRMRALLTTCVLGAVSFAVAAGLYLIFGKLNSAEVHWATEEVKLGGPIAGFAATFLLLAWFENRSTKDKDFIENWRVSAAFAGSWRITSKSSGPGARQTFSNTVARLDENGHISFKGSLLDGAEQPIGSWRSNEVFCTHDGFAYSYTLNDKLATGSNVSLGFCSVLVTQRDNKHRPTILTGNWDVIGSKEHHDGSIQFERQHA